MKRLRRHAGEILLCSLSPNKALMISHTTTVRGKPIITQLQAIIATLSKK